MTPAEELTAAANKLDRWASEATPGPWVVWGGSERSLVCTTVEGCTCGGGLEGYGHEPGCGLEQPPDINATHEDAAYIAAMNPLIGTALASALREEADQADVLKPNICLVEIARLINGGAS